eukprot:4137463-Prymnesium_polylepis.1
MTAQQRRHRRSDTAKVLGDERDDGVLLVLDRVRVVARLRRHPAEAGGVVERAIHRRALRPRAVDVAEQLLLRAPERDEVARRRGR